MAPALFPRDRQDGRPGPQDPALQLPGADPQPTRPASKILPALAASRPGGAYRRDLERSDILFCAAGGAHSARLGRQERS